MNAGTPIGPYQIVAKIGEGGMGEVYRAHDTKLGRDVAIKFLPEALAQDPDRRSRFEREARLLAALHHPHIATIFGVEDSTGVLAIVMELVEGPTLAERIAKAKGPKAEGTGLPMAEALGIARQIVDALDAAHEKGIVHRDLKPANIKLTKDGSVKVLDFGLATAVASAAGTTSAVATQMVSEPGRIVGTPAYMSPEQARGQTVDKRTDIWAFGCVLYEMLTGTRAFTGATTSDVMANVLQREPEWRALPASTPPVVRRLIERCLEKDQKRRLRDIGDARTELDGGAGPDDAPRSEDRWSLFPALLLTAAAVAVLAGGAVWALKPAPDVASTRAGVARYLITPPESLTVDEVEGRLDISPDGRRLVYVAGHSGVPALYVHELDQFSGTLIPGTDGADDPAISPDGAWVAFAAGGKIKKVPLSGGEPIVLCESPVGLGLSWRVSDTILFNPGPARSIWRVSAQGGAPSALTTLGKNETDHHFPEMLPDGKSLLYSAQSGTAGEQTYVQSLVTGQRQLLVSGGGARYLRSGYLMYVQNNVVFVAPFDAGRLAFTGSPAIALQGVRQTLRGTAQFAVSQNGSIVYLAGEGDDEQESAVWVDRSGAEKPMGLPGRAYLQPRLSPDGHRLVVTVTPTNATTPNPQDLWIWDLDRRTLGRVTSDGGQMALWSPDGRRLAFSVSRRAPADIYARPFDSSGPEELILKGTGATSFPLSWSPDGRFLAFVTVTPSTANDIWTLDVTAKAAPRPFLQTPFREGAPTFSPDGRYIAYVSDSSGRNEVYVRSFPESGQEIQVSADGGNEPVWSRQSQQLFYVQGNAMMVVDIATVPALKVGQPHRLFDMRYRRSRNVWPNYDVTPDGQRFVMIKSGSQPAPAHLNVVLNWRPGS